MRLRTLLPVCATWVGCATGPVMPPATAPPAEEASVSLFPSDAAVLAEEAISHILDAAPRLPERSRIALLHIDHRSAGRFWGFGPYWTTIAPATQQGPR